MKSLHQGPSFFESARLVLPDGYMGHLLLISLLINLLAFAVPIHMLQVYDRVLSSGHVETLIGISIGVGIALVFQGMLDFFRLRIFAVISNKLENRLLPVVFRETVTHDKYGNGLKTNMGSLQSLKSFIASPWMGALFDIPWVPLYIAVVFFFHQALGWMAMAAVLVMIFLSYFNHKATEKQIADSSKGNQSVRLFFETCVRQAESIKGLGMIGAATNRLTDRMNEEAGKTLDTGAVLHGYSAFVRFFRYLLQVLALSAGAYLVLRGELSAGAIIANSILFTRALAPIEALSAGWRNMEEALEGTYKLAFLLQQNNHRQKTLKDVEGLPNGHIAVEDLYLHYGQPPRPFLKGLSFQLVKGDVLAVVGASGSGKSTLMKLMIGAIDPTGGLVKLGGHGVHELSDRYFNRNSGYLPQQIMLFPGTILENISRYGEPELSRAIEAARLAGCHEMIEKFSEGYATPLDSDPLPLSQGQQQRIGLARALYGNPQYVFLDEPNSNLDSEGENALLHAMSQLKERGSTLVIVAHRTSVLHHCNKMLVMAEGQIKDFGLKEDVLRRLNSRPA